VNASALNLRSGPSTGAPILSSAPKNDYVLITGKTGNWLHVSHNLVSGYMHEAYLNLYTAKNVELGYGTVNANKVNLRSGPGTHYKIVAQTQKGDQAYIIGFNKQWFKVICKGQVCYIRSDYLTLTEIPYENQKSSKNPIFFVNGKSTGLTPSAEALSGTSSSSLRSQIVNNAKKHLGTPYVWGGNQPGGFDCSGFTEYIYKQSGISLPRTTTEQYQKGYYVDKSNLQPGDLVFLANTYRSGISHVGIYIGNGSMIHASSSKGITISDLSGSYYTKHYYGSRRVIA
jgi:cell wall-associated NlpC family hydrolase